MGGKIKKILKQKQDNKILQEKKIKGNYFEILKALSNFIIAK